MAISIFPSTAAEFVSNNFVVDMNDTSNNTADTGGVKQAGPYSISFSSGDSSFDVYLVDEDGNSVGYSNNTSIVASGLFTTVVIFGVAQDEIVSFLYQGSVNNADGEGDEPGAGAYLESISASNLPDVDNTVTISGGNFGANTEITFESGATVLPAKSITVVSGTELLVTRPDGLVENEAPYDLKAINTGVNPPTGTNAHILTDAITVDKATGGTVSLDSGFAYHLFESSDDFEVFSSNLSVDYLVVAGGGGGAGGHIDQFLQEGTGGAGGGGGGGGLVNGSDTLTPGVQTISVGAGGSRGGSKSDGTNGGDSVFGTLVTADGGGGGGYRAGLDGGSGGGSGGEDGPTSGGTALNSGAQGFSGGDLTLSIDSAGAGGGGAGQAGTNQTDDRIGTDGGDGLQFADFANAISLIFDGGYFAGGGGGGTRAESQGAGSGGFGGAGDGGFNDSSATPGEANSGGGGGGGLARNDNPTGSLLGGSGGSGVVIVRYAI